jgi:hypothetical protein
MSDMQKCDKFRMVVACVVLVVFVIAGWFIFPVVMGALGVPSTFTCHCIGGALGFIGGILFLRKYVC